MTVSKIFTELGLINDNTEVWIRDNDLHVLAHGNWYQDNVLDTWIMKLNLLLGKMTTIFILILSKGCKL